MAFGFGIAGVGVVALICFVFGASCGWVLPQSPPSSMWSTKYKRHGRTRTS